MYKPLREDNQQGTVNTTVATVTNLEKGNFKLHDQKMLAFEVRGWKHKNFHDAHES